MNKLKINELLMHGTIRIARIPGFFNVSLGFSDNLYMDGPEGETDGRTDERTNRKSPHSTGLRPLLGLLPKKVHDKKSKKS